MSYEWTLTTPARKEFASADGLATAVRLSSASNDFRGGRFFVRFIFGRYIDGKFERAVRDDGIVISGPNYEELSIAPDGSIAEPDLLELCARLLGWSGSMAILGSTPASP